MQKRFGHTAGWAVVLVIAALAAVTAVPAPAQSEGQLRASFTPGGLRRYAPETWGVLSVELQNGGEQPAEVLASAFFEGEANLQYGRRVWVPPGASRATWFPVYVPAEVALGTDRARLKALLLDDSSGRDKLIQTSGGAMLHDALLIVDHDGPIIGFYTDASDPRIAHDNERLVTSIKEAIGPQPPVFFLQDTSLTRIELGLQGMRHLILAGDSWAKDSAAILALRRWLQGGGRLWIMLDQIDWTLAEQLLGDEFPCELVDRIGLSELVIDRHPAGVSSPPAVREFETPVELLRVIVHGVDVGHTVDGWPVSFWGRFGRGQVLFTTLGPRGWYQRPQPVLQQRPRGRGFQPGPPAPPAVMGVVATGPLQDVINQFLQPAAPAWLSPSELQPHLAEQIGYRIPGRGVVAALLGFFCGVIVVAGFWLARARRLELLGWIAPATALLTALAFVGIGLGARHQVPATVATAQLVDVVPGSDELVVEGELSHYIPSASSHGLGTTRGGLFQLELTALAGETRRMVWTDVDRWHWENLALPPGLHAAPFRFSTQLESPMYARGEFGPSGFRGKAWTGPFAGAADALIATGTRRASAVNLAADGTFEAGPASVMAPGQFMAAAMLSDRQRRRQQLFELVFPRLEPDALSQQPKLFFWAPPIDTAFDFPADSQRVGEALVAIPLEIERAPAGTRVVIPSSFLGYESSMGPDGSAMSSIFDRQTRRWVSPLRSATRCWLRFGLPPALLPVEPDQATLTIQISAPSRPFEILGYDGEQVVSLARRESPLGVLQFRIDRPDVLRPDASGGLRLAVDVGEPPEPPSQEEHSEYLWKIEELQLELSGTTLPEGSR